MVTDDTDRRGEDLGQRGVAPRADVDGDVVARLEVGGRADVRNAVRPDEDLALGVERERLVLALSDQRPQRGVIAALDRDRDRSGARRGHVAAELVETTLATAERSCGDDRAGESGECEGNE